MAEYKWNKKIFAKLLSEARGVRSWRQFAADCDISYVQMRKLDTETQENPPRPKLIRKVAAHAFGDIDLEDLMFAAGIRMGDMTVKSDDTPPALTAYDKYKSLSVKDRKTVDRFIDYLIYEMNLESKEQQKGED